MKPVTYTPKPTMIIWQAIGQALKISKWLNRSVRLKFNQHQVTISPKDNQASAVKKWDTVQSTPPAN